MLYIARQPIFDRTRATRAYELLFRDSEDNRCTASDPELACKTTIDTAVLVGLDVLSEGQDIFLNCTHDSIVGGYPTLFPPARTVVEILETVEPTANLLSACKQLKNAGYRLALDDFVDHPRLAPLIELADIIKIDVLVTPLQHAGEVLRRYRTGRKMLAEKVETNDEFTRALNAGFDLFQGYFFCHPNILTTRNLPASSHGRLRIFSVLARSPLDLFEVENVIKSDPSLCYRLLRYLNSPVFYLDTETRSILHALTLLGEEKLRAWLLLMCAVSGSSEGKSELITAALVRAKFSELLARYISGETSSLFITGLLSLMDAILEMPLPELLNQIILPDNVRAALSGDDNSFRHCLELVITYEKGDWHACQLLADRLHVPFYFLGSAYLEAVQWTRDLRATTSFVSAR